MCFSRTLSSIHLNRVIMILNKPYDHFDVMTMYWKTYNLNGSENPAAVYERELTEILIGPTNIYPYIFVLLILQIRLTV